jgi:hypothetical protein
MNPPAETPSPDTLYSIELINGAQALRDLYFKEGRGSVFTYKKTRGRPGGNEWLEEDILALKKQGVQTIVSLLDRNEIYELGLEKEPELCLKNDIEYINFPITDRKVPKADAGLYNFIGHLKGKISAGSHMAIHRKMPIPAKFERV